MSAMLMFLIAAIMGLVGGIAHQIHDSEEKNEKKAMIRAAIMGGIAGVLTVAIAPIADTNVLLVSTFVTGWFGDSVVLNIVRRGAKNNAAS